MPRPISIAIACLALNCLAQPVWSQTPGCEKLSAQERAAATEILQKEHLYACCDGTIMECLQKKPACALAVRLADNVCRRVAAKQDRQNIVRALQRRAQTLLAIEFNQPAKFDLSQAGQAGDPQAPITLVEFASARGPHCARMTPPTYRAVVDGPLKGKVKLYLKHFPLRKNPHSKEAALAFMAAGRKGRLWDFVLHAYENFDKFSLDKQVEWAAALGLDKDEFQAAMKDPALKKSLVKDKKEGLVNGVDSTPTFFINGHKYTGDLEIEELIDVLEEVYEKGK